MSSERKTHLRPEEYLTLERKAEFRSEYLDGDMVAMSGGSRENRGILNSPSLACSVNMAEIYERVHLP